jgi:hypothetical protein
MGTSAEEADRRASELVVVRKGDYRYLINESDTPIRRLRYSTAATGESYVSSVPTFEIESIPAKSGVKIEEVDPYEDGFLIWQVDGVDWVDGAEYRGTKKLTEKKATSVNWSSVDREKTEIGEPTPPQKLDDEKDG